MLAEVTNLTVKVTNLLAEVTNLTVKVTNLLVTVLAFGNYFFYRLQMDILKQDSVTQDNSLIEACYSMTLNEKRLLLLGPGKVDPAVFPDITRQISFKLTTFQAFQRH